MKYLAAILFCSAFYVCVSAVSFGQIPNAGFEQWTSGEPDGWVSSNFPSFATPVTQSTMARSGSSALKGEVVNSIVGPYPPWVSSGQDAAGFPVSQRHAALTGYFRFAPLGSDLFAVVVLMLKNGSAIGGGGFETQATQSTYAPFTVNIDYGTPETPDTCFIFITIGPDTGDPTPGSTMYVDDLAFSGIVSVEEGLTPFTFKLLQNYPNPFNPATTINYEIKSTERVMLKVHNVLGQEVAVLVDEVKDPGRYNVRFDASRLASGVYFYRITAGTFTDVKRMVLVR